jgi:hypothetical protein
MPDTPAARPRDLPRRRHPLTDPRGIPVTDVWNGAVLTPVRALTAWGTATGR